MKCIFSVQIILLLLCSAILHAQWTQTNGPCTASISYCTVMNATKVQDISIFVGTWGGGVFRSTDRGVSWTYVNDGISTTYIYSLAAKDTNLFVGTYHHGAYRSSDRGNTWTEINSGLGLRDVMGFAFAGESLFVATQDWGEVFRSTDNGDNWIAVNNGLPSTSFYGIACSNGHVFAASSYGVYVSSNGGSEWTMGGWPYMDNAFSILAVDSIVFAQGLGGLFRTTDYGARWTIINNPPLSNVLWSTGSIIYAKAAVGLYQSTNYGESWSILNNNISIGAFATYLDSTAINNEGMLNGTNGGIYLSSDNGITWHQSNAGLIANTVNALASTTDDQGHIYLFAGTNGNGAFFSTDLGASWNAINSGLTNNYIQALAVGQSGVIDLKVFAGTLGGVFRYNFTGSNWIARNSGLTDNNIWTLIYNGNNLFAGTAAGVFYSSDDSTWSQRNNGLISTSVTVMSLDETYVYSAYDVTFFRSTDNGLAWDWIGGFLPWSITAIKSTSVSVGGDTNLFISTSANGVLRSTNRGSNWTAMNDGLTDLNTRALYVRENAADDHKLFVGTSTGMFSFFGNGASWIPINDGFPAIGVNSFAEGGGYIFAACNRGVWRRLISEITSVNSSTITLPDKFFLSQNYPNPFNPITMIKFRVPHSTFVSLKVFDLLGREVAILVNEDMISGSHERVFDGSSLSSGVYLYRLQTETFTQTKKLLLLK